MSKWPSQVSPSSSHRKDTLEQYRHAEQILTNRLAGQKAQEAHVIKTNEVHESCVCGQRYAFWYNLAPLVCLHLWFSFTKGKKKSKRINRKHVFGCFCQHLSKPLRSFQALELGTVLHKLVQNSWCQMFGENMPMTLQEISGKVHSLVKGLPYYLCNSTALGTAPYPDMEPCLVPYLYS